MVEERWQDFLWGLYNGKLDEPFHNYLERANRELAAHGLTVCEISKVSEVSAVYGEMNGPCLICSDASSNGRTIGFEPVNAGSTPAASTKPSELSPQTLEVTADVSEREQAIARVLGEPWGGKERTAIELARAIISADPWTHEGQVWKEACINTAKERQSLYSDVTTLRAEVQRLRSSLRDLLHLLDTAEGLWVSDKPASHTGMLDIGIDGILPWATRSDGDAMWVAPGLYWQQTFRDTDAVKLARELIHEGSPMRYPDTLT